MLHSECCSPLSLQPLPRTSFPLPQHLHVMAAKKLLKSSKLGEGAAYLHCTEVKVLTAVALCREEDVQCRSEQAPFGAGEVLAVLCQHFPCTLLVNKEIRTYTCIQCHSHLG